MIRVLVVDDSPTARELMTDILNQDPGIRVIGMAGNGSEAVTLARQLRPDLIVMDVHMPDEDGMATTKRIMAEHPMLIVLVSATLDPDEIRCSIDVLQCGALMLLPKPTLLDATNPTRIRHFVGRLKALKDVKIVRQRPLPVRTPPKVQVPRCDQVEVVGVAASTGGPRALKELFDCIQPGFTAPIVVVQHMAPGFTVGLAKWLRETTHLPVEIAVADEELRAGRVYMAPDGMQLGVDGRRRAIITQDAPVDGFRPSATWLFNSIATTFGSRSVAVMLTGMGLDGVEGLRSIRKNGGRILVQDQDSSVVFGMPGAAIAEGLSDFVSSPGRIGAYLNRIIHE